MGNTLKKLLSRLLVVCAAAVIIAAIGVGALRIFLTQLPSYRAELVAWVADNYGLAVDFERLDTRLGLAGPELTFFGVSIGAQGAAAPLFEAESAVVAFDTPSLLLSRELTIRRLTLVGMDWTLTRRPDGAYDWPLAAVGAAADAPPLLDALPPEVELLVRESRVEYADSRLERPWQFTELELRATRARDRVAVEVQAVPAAGLGERVELVLEGDAAPGRALPEQWRIFAELRGAALARLGRLLPLGDGVEIDGHGDIAAWIDPAVAGGRQGMVSVDLEDVSFSGPAAGTGGVYERAAFTIEWKQAARRGWQLAFSDVDVTRNGERWPSGGNTTLELTRGDGGEIESMTARTDFVRLEDLRPLVAAFPDADGARRWLELDPVGEFRDVEVTVDRGDDGWLFAVAGEFDGFGMRARTPWPGFAGLSGEVRTDARTGRVRFESSDARFEWPRLFRDGHSVDSLSGVVVWRQGRNVVRIVSDDLVFSTGGGEFRSNLELSLPLDGASPYLDLETRLDRIDVAAVRPLLPVHAMPGAVAQWLETALTGGRATDVQLDFYGPLAAFPFDNDEGLFRVVADVANGRLNFIEGWPIAEALDGRLVFENASFLARGAGRVLGNRAEELTVAIADMRAPVLTLDAETVGPLADVLEFLRSAPLVAAHLGPGYDRIRAHAGAGEVRLDLDLPLLEMDAFTLDAELGIVDGELEVDGLAARATEINGVVQIDEGSVRAEAVDAVFLGGPATARVGPDSLSGYRTRIDVDGETTAEAVLGAFGLPFRDQLAGQTAWRGSLHIPSLASEAPAPVLIRVESNLAGISARFPEPFAKPPAEPARMRVEFRYPTLDTLSVAGNIGASRRFALDLRATDAGYRLERGALRFGGAEPALPAQPGFIVEGSLPYLNLGDWIALADRMGTAPAETPLIAAELELADFLVFGQQLGTTSLSADRARAAWHIDIESAPIAGTVTIPRGVSDRPQIVADMRRLYMSAGSTGGTAGIDPRTLPGLSLTADEVALGAIALGRVAAQIVPEPTGLRLVSFSSVGEALTGDASGRWRVGRDGMVTEIAATLRSDDVAGALETLRFDPVLAAEMAELQADLSWPGAPSRDWMSHVSGDVSVRFETGSMLDIEPGAGRMVGLMSILAIPRRLTFDFRDVFNKGFVFDEITGDFDVVDGNAYTNNLLMTGPSAEIGVVGRTGLRDRDYEQQAIVTAEPGKVLPTVGALLSGPGVGAALLIFTQIFKEPLKGIGQAAYCITGSWDEPKVERTTAERLEQGSLCAALPAEREADEEQQANR